MKLIIGVLIGLVLSSVISYAAPRVIGDGFLSGWVVTINGREVCDSPYVWTKLREIDCD